MSSKRIFMYFWMFACVFDPIYMNFVFSHPARRETMRIITINVLYQGDWISTSTCKIILTCMLNAFFTNALTFKHFVHWVAISFSVIRNSFILKKKAVNVSKWKSLRIEVKFPQTIGFNAVRKTNLTSKRFLFCSSLEIY